MLCCAASDVITSAHPLWGSAMRRRQFIALLGGAAVAWPSTARAQKTPIIAWLDGGGEARPDSLVAFRRCLATHPSQVCSWRFRYVDGSGYRWRRYPRSSGARCVRAGCATRLAGVRRTAQKRGLRVAQPFYSFINSSVRLITLSCFTIGISATSPNPFVRLLSLPRYDSSL